MKLSIIATLYQSAPYIEEFCRRAAAVAEQLAGESYEIVLVNDGSPDNSLDIAVSLTKTDSRLRVIDLSRNFGHHKAMMTGLAHTTGELVFLLDSDLEEQPEWLIPFAEQMDKEDCDVVFGIQETRKGGFIEQWTGEWFYKIFNMATKLNLPKNIVTARLMSRNYVNALLLHKEREFMIGGIWMITGFKQQSQTVLKLNTSETTYTLRRKLSLLVNSITSFSSAPLIGIFYTGIVISIISFIYIVYILYNRFFSAAPLSGWTSVMASIWFIGGMIISFLGIIGIYLSKIFSETKQRPNSIIRKIYCRNEGKK